jgi:hypothetical protein
VNELTVLMYFAQHGNLLWDLTGNPDTRGSFIELVWDYSKERRPIQYHWEILEDNCPLTEANHERT